jgi:hypothetical protein
MPYAIAHPAAILPLHRWLGRHSVPSALAIGSVIPDAWYLVPFLGRPDTHSAHGALLYCVPLAILAYLAFHLLAKEPLLALLPRPLAAKLQAWTVEGLPRASWAAVALCAALGALTQVVWDSFTHEGLLSARYPVMEATLLTIGNYELRLLQLFQHASTLLGAAFLGWWIARQLAQAPEVPLARERAHPAVAFALVAVPAAVLFASLGSLHAAPGVEELRSGIRSAILGAAAALLLALMAYCLIWHARKLLGKPTAAR